MVLPSPVSLYSVLLKDMLVETKVLQFLSERSVEMGGLICFSAVSSQEISVFVVVST